MTVKRIFFFLNRLLFKTFKRQFHKIQNVHNCLSNILIRFKNNLKPNWFRVDNIRSVNHCCFITSVLTQHDQLTNRFISSLSDFNRMTLQHNFPSRIYKTLFR